jgi:hypothetical protein
VSNFGEYDGKLSALNKKALIVGKHRRRICSFTKTFESPLLWTHYANSFRGICIEIETEESIPYKMVEVNYSPFKLFLKNYEGANYSDFVDIILSAKNEAWEYESEIRFLTNETFIDKGFSIESIYLGLRIKEEYRWLIKKIVSNRVNIYETSISANTNKIRIAQPII